MAVGFPEGAVAFEYISMGTDAVLAIDNSIHGNVKEGIIDGVVLVAAFSSGNATILHNGGSNEKCVNLYNRDNRDFYTWFQSEGTLYYKKIEMEEWVE